MDNTGYACFFDATGELAQLNQLVNDALASGAKSLMVLAADGNQFEAAKVSLLLKKLSIPVFGGVFPEIVYQERNYDKGSIVIAFSQACEMLNVKGLSDSDADYIDQLEPFMDKVQEIDAAVVLVDGLSSRVAAFLQDLYEMVGVDVSVIGGGAGSLSFEQKPCLFSNEGLLQDSAQLVCFPSLKHVAINHGWEPFSGPYMVTSADKTRIEAIDFKPAFDVYRGVVEQDAAKTFGDDNFFDIAQAYPVGMSRYGGRYVVRDPLFVEDNTLVCVGEVPPSQEIYLLKGDKDLLVNAAQKSGEKVASYDVDLALVFDCISRRLFLQDEFEQELTAIGGAFDDSIPAVGVLCLGEIAGNGETALEFYNKTVVVGGVACG